jgi:hypothetical protein
MGIMDFGFIRDSNDFRQPRPQPPILPRQTRDFGGVGVALGDGPVSLTRTPLGGSQFKPAYAVHGLQLGA